MNIDMEKKSHTLYLNIWRIGERIHDAFELKALTRDSKVRILTAITAIAAVFTGISGYVLLSHTPLGVVVIAALFLSILGKYIDYVANTPETMSPDETDEKLFGSRRRK